jgi:hypothetical protein
LATDIRYSLSLLVGVAMPAMFGLLLAAGLIAACGAAHPERFKG